MKLPQVSGEDTIKILERNGFAVVSTKGSHVKLRQVTSSGLINTVIVPKHKTLKMGTLRAIIAQAGLNPNTFLVKL